MLKIIRQSLDKGIVTADNVAPAENFRGRPVFDFAAWKDACPGAAVCPTGAISFQDNAGTRKVTVDYGKCIFCGLCAEACPTLAIQMTPDYEICTREIMDLVYEKEDLLIDGCGKDSSYNFYRHAGIGVTQPRGNGLEETPPVDVRSLMP